MIGLSEKTREEFYSSTYGNPLYTEQVKQLSIQTQKKFIDMQNCLDWQKDMLEKCELTLKNTKTLRKDKRAASSLINLLNNHDK